MRDSLALPEIPNTEVSDFAAACLRCNAQKMVDPREHLVRFVDDALARFRQADFTLGPLEESNADFFFQLLDL